tara:strand:+ start:906 stop:1754 length:849 start_codon:yes stop_codon:yes gene_type:complete
MNKIFLIVFLSFTFTATSANTTDVKNTFFNSIESFFNENFEDTEFSIESKEGFKPEIGILTFKPLKDTENGLDFFQGSFFTHDGDRETLNLGIGKRILSSDKSFMYGFNVFYDHEFDYDHKRASLGGEIKSSIIELNTNHYFGVSDPKTGKNNIEEEVADGYDIELGAHVPYIPSAKIFAKIFEYEIPGGSDYEGKEYLSKVGIPNTGMNIELGFKEFGNNSYKDHWFVNISYNLRKINSGKNFINSEAYEKISMKDKKYEKVRRENLILKSKSFTVKAGGF